MHFLSEFNLRELLSSFVVLLAITDIPGNLPIVINLQNKGIKISAHLSILWCCWCSSFMLAKRF